MGSDGRNQSGLAALSDEALIEKIHAGEEEAFPVLFDRYLGTLEKYARRWLPRRLSRKVSVQDVLQEARIAALGRVLDFERRDGNSVRNWLLKVVELKARDAVRRYAGTARRAVDREISRGHRPETAAIVGPGPSPSQEAVGAELAERAMHDLPEHYREVLRLARREGLSLREIAERTDGSREAVKKTYARALSRFTVVFDRLRGASHG